MLIHFPTELSHCNSLFRSDNYYMDLFVRGYYVQHHISQDVKEIIYFFDW